MTHFRRTVSRSALTSILASGVVSAVASATDLSRYRHFQLGADLSTVAKQTGANPSEAKVIHRRPALIQELEWRARSPGSASQAEPAKEMVFSFYDGALFRIAVDYDRYQTEGLTDDDMVEAVSGTYGLATRPTAPARVAPPSYGDREEIVAQWQDSQYRFDLIRSSYGRSFRLVGVFKSLEELVQAATIEAARLDEKEAPQREADRVAREKHIEQARLEQPDL